MSAAEEHAAGAARVVLPCDELQPCIDFFVEQLGFRLERIAPADDPRCADLAGHGLRLALERGGSGAAGHLRLAASAPRPELRAPNGTRIEWVCRQPPTAPADSWAQALEEPQVTRAPGAGAGDWVVGRAGMGYRDLIPDRLGGRLVASHIRIADGGPVPDQVHHHGIEVQLIFCRRGWVRVVYEDQGPPFVLAAGDLVLQPPHIRHRVLESSAGLEVIELASPAEHDTFFDHALPLPTATRRPERAFWGQRFLHARAEGAAWRACPRTGWEARDLGLARASGRRAAARVLRAVGQQAPPGHPLVFPGAELCLLFVLAGELGLASGERELRLGRDDCALLPGHVETRGWAASPDLELFEVGLPASAQSP